MLHIIEGAFCVWTAEEIQRILGNDAKIFMYCFDVREHGNVDPDKDPHGELKNKVISSYYYFLSKFFF